METYIFLSLQTNVDPRDEVFSYHHQFDDKPSGKSEDRKEYNIGVLRHLQVIFGHLAASRLQYYVPRGFWKQFRYFEGFYWVYIQLLEQLLMSQYLPLTISFLGYGVSQ